jgi:hypothetical protein
VTGSFDGTLAIWEIRSTAGASGIQPELIARWQAHGLATGGKARTPVAAGMVIAAAPLVGSLPEVGCRLEIRCVCFVTESKLLFSGGNDHKIKVRCRRFAVLPQKTVVCF